jgi:hypothetical protein
MAAKEIDPAVYIIGGVVVLWLAKQAAQKALDLGTDLIIDPIKKVAGATVYGADELLVHGLRKDEDESWGAYVFEYDAPFTDRRIPLYPPAWKKDPDQSYMEHAFELDLPGVPEYDLRDIPGDIKGLFGRVF